MRLEQTGCFFGGYFLLERDAAGKPSFLESPTDWALWLPPRRTLVLCTLLSGFKMKLDVQQEHSRLPNAGAVLQPQCYVEGNCVLYSIGALPPSPRGLLFSDTWHHVFALFGPTYLHLVWIGGFGVESPGSGSCRE